jgi:hypothetical protein
MITTKSFKKEYLKPGENQDGIELRPLPHTLFPKYYKEGEYVHPCPQCFGYGKWNLLLNEYGDGVHFQASCNHCNGWGWVNWEDAQHIHQYVEISRPQQFLSVQQCSICGKKIDVDSSG